MTKAEIILMLSNNVKALQEIKTVVNNTNAIDEKIADTENTLLQLFKVVKE